MDKKNTANEKIGLVQSFLALPSPLRKQVSDRMLAALIAAIVTVISLFTTKEAEICIGFLLALGFAYLGLSILWAFREGNIIVARMVVSKDRKDFRGQHHLLLREACVKDLTSEEVQTVKYTITPRFRDKGYITAGTVMNIYISQNNPQSILAYEILGEL